MKTEPNAPINPTVIDGCTYDIGLTKREYISSVILQGILANRWSMETGYYNAESKAKMAVEQADALIAELNK